MVSRVDRRNAYFVYHRHLIHKLDLSIYTSGDTILADIAARPALALTMLAGMAAGTSAFITDLVAIIKHKDHSLLVYISSTVGALIILFLAGEILSPH